MARKFRRRKWLIDMDIQVRLGVRLTFYLLAYLTVFLVFSFGEKYVFHSASLAPAEAGEAAWRQTAGMLRLVAAPLGFALGCTILHGILLLHRLAGPVYRIRVALDRLSDGDLTDFVQLRGGDYLEDLALSYNESVGRLRADVDAVRSRLGALRETADEEAVREEAGALAALLERYRIGREPPRDETPEPAAAPEDPAVAATGEEAPARS